MEFSELSLQPELNKALNKQEIIKPTQVQWEVFSPMIKGKPVIVQSQTGTGKTLAYLLPLMNQLLVDMKENPEERFFCRFLILVPTHELAMQVLKQVSLLAENGNLPIIGTAVVGNVNITRQIEALKKKPQIIIGTPGRVLELIKKKKIAAHQIQTIIVDEADKMLAKQQIAETESVMKCCMRDTVKCFFSASMSGEAVAMAEQKAPEAQVIRLEENGKVPDTITHCYIECDRREKLDMLRSVIASLKPKKAMVFINRVYDIERATKKLLFHHYKTACLHGSGKKQEREKVVREFRSGSLEILIATDIAARGLHFDNVELIIHYSIPEEEKDYLHRAGRCGRNGMPGVSLSLVTAKEVEQIHTFSKKLHINIEEKILKKGSLLDKSKKE